MEDYRNIWAEADRQWGLPTRVRAGEQELDINSDFRVILTIFAALADPELTDQEKSWVVLNRFYTHPHQLKDPAAGLEAFARFADGGVKGKKGPRLMDWEQDYPILAPAVDRVLGYSSRQQKYLHWWEYLGAFREISQGLFAQVAAIRSLRARGKKLTPEQEAFARNHRELVTLAPRLTREEQDQIKQLLGEAPEEKGAVNGNSSNH